MILILVLVVAYAVVRVLPAGRLGGERDRWRLALGAGMVTAGMAHLLNPVPFVQHIPPAVPRREALVLITGLIEIAFGPALWFTRGPARRLAGWALGGYLVAVFPGNVYVAVAGVEVEGQPGGIYHWLRLPLQVVLVWLALWGTGAVGRHPAPHAARGGAPVRGRHLPRS